MPVLKLDALTVQNLPRPEGKASKVYRDTTVTGFCVEVQPSGTKTYALKYRNKYQEQKQYKIGRVGDITFAEAKRQASKVLGIVTTGGDPSEQRKVDRNIPTIKELSVRYLEYVRTYKRSPEIDERYLRIHLLPKFGNRRINEINRTQVLEWMNAKMRDEGYAQATVNRWQVILCHMLRMAGEWKLPGAEVNPLAGLKQKDPNNKVERFLTQDETRRLRAAVEQSPNPLLGPIVALLLLTGCRKRELLDAKWDEFRLDQRTWRIPMSKTGKARHVPLSDDVVTILRSLPRYDDCPFVLPNPKTMQPFHTFFNAWNTARIRAGVPDLRVHDLRHSMASNMANSGQSLFVIGQVLGHTQPRTTTRYAHLSNETLHKAAAAASAASGWNATA